MATKKQQKKKEEKLIEDRTFGLKNKNKSKKVQEFINTVEKTVKHSSNKAFTANKEAKTAQKVAKQLQEEELRVLFNEGLSSEFGKKKSKGSAVAKALGVAEQTAELKEILDEFSSDSEDELDVDPDSGVIIIEDDEPVAVEIFREKTIEDLIEEQRAKLLSEGKRGTPVTAESFARWRADKLVRKQAEAEARLKAEQSKKKGGKGLSVLSGKELFNYNASLFVDDDAAIDAKEEQAFNEETRALEMEEEKRAQIEAEKAQAEQLRLAEAERLRQEEMIRIHESRKAAALTSPLYLVFNSIQVNKVIFDIDEDEDLEPLPEEEEQDGGEDAVDDDGDDDEVEIGYDIDLANHKEEEQQGKEEQTPAIVADENSNNYADG